MNPLSSLSSTGHNNEPVPRSLAESPRFSPCWRHQVFNRYAVQIVQSEDVPSTLKDVLTKERDFFLRELVKFQFGLTSQITGPLRYAIDCAATQAENRIAGVIKAMVVADRSYSQIGEAIGTTSTNVRAFEALYFDVRRFLDHRGWLEQVCYPELTGNEPGYAQAEITWLGVAFRRGWNGLAGVLSPYAPVKPAAGLDEITSFLRGALSRGADFQHELAFRGIRPSGHDLQLFSLMSKQLRTLGFGGISLGDLDQKKPLELKERKAQEEAEQLIRGLSRESRRRIQTFMQIVKSGLG